MWKSALQFIPGGSHLIVPEFIILVTCNGNADLLQCVLYIVIHRG